MSLNLTQKQVEVAEVNEIAARSHSVIAAQYRGVTVARLTSLRVKARQNGVYLRVVKNTLARRAMQGTDFECLSPALAGPLVLAFSQDDPGAGARVIKEFLKDKDNDKLIVKALAFGGRLLGPNDLDMLANMPTREQAISMLMSLMKEPLDKLARTFNEIPGKLVRTVEAVRMQKAGMA